MVSVKNAVKNAGETLGFKEMSLFKFPDAYDSDDELHVRMDGIIAVSYTHLDVYKRQVHKSTISV